MSDILEMVREYLHYDTDESKESAEKTDKRLQGMIDRGIQRLQTIAGAELDFSVPSLHQSLLLDYCRYADSQALEVFEKNFADELLSLHFENQVKVENNEDQNTN